MPRLVLYLTDLLLSPTYYSPTKKRRRKAKRAEGGLRVLSLWKNLESLFLYKQPVVVVVSVSHSTLTKKCVTLNMHIIQSSFTYSSASTSNPTPPSDEMRLVRSVHK